MSWSQTGPVGRDGHSGAVGANGAPGANGAAGSTGTPGPTGPSDVFAAGTAIAALTPTRASYGQLALPAGNYLVEAKASFIGAAGTQMSCRLLAPTLPSAKKELDSTTTGAASSSDERSVLSLIGTQTLTAPETVEFQCSGEGTIDNARVVAIAVGALHGSLPVD